MKTTPKYWRKATSLKTLNITAKEWFDKVNGNSYFSAQVTINNQHTIKLPFQYGYGSHYYDMVSKYLLKHGWIATKLHILHTSNKVIINDVRIENCLKRDVVVWGQS